MSFLKMLIAIPVIAVLLVFAFVNNDLATFSLWPFNVEVTVSQSVAILFFVILGYLWGGLNFWLSNAPVRAALRQHKKQNKQLNKEQQKLVKEMETLQENLEALKPVEPVEDKKTIGERFKNMFSSSKTEAETNTKQG